MPHELTLQSFTDRKRDLDVEPKANPREPTTRPSHGFYFNHAGRVRQETLAIESGRRCNRTHIKTPQCPCCQRRRRTMSMSSLPTELLMASSQNETLLTKTSSAASIRRLACGVNSGPLNAHKRTWVSSSSLTSEAGLRTRQASLRRAVRRNRQE